MGTLIFIFSLCLFLNLNGCASVKEAARGFAGVSTKALEETRKDAVQKTVDFPLDECFRRAEEILAETGSYVYAKDEKKKMLAVYVSAEDTTAVGVFFKEIHPGRTLIEVSSLSTYGKETIAKTIIAGLEHKGEKDEGKAAGDKPAD